MRGAARAVSLCVALACGGAGAAFAADSGQPAVDPNTACATDFNVIRIGSEPHAVIVQAFDLPAPFTGTITAYGHDTKWSGTVGRWNETTWYGIREASLIVIADGPIEAVEYAPTWASCTFHAGAHARGGNEDDRDADRPSLIVTNPAPVDPATCQVPYRSPAVMRTPDTTSPRSDVHGAVRVAVALDEQGAVQFTRVVSSPGAVLDATAVQAARQTTYRAAVFRCRPVSAGYVFTIEFPSG